MNTIFKIWRLKFISLGFAGLLLAACADDEWPQGDLVITNGDATGTIIDIYLSTDCTDSWGNVDYTGLSIAPGAASAKYELDTRTYDVLACFDHDLADDLSPITCGQALDVEVYDYGTYITTIADQGIVAVPANCL